ncbi:MAG: BlaI/MecI/CopY family transcriptional regulator [Planctomycetes bacterium]|nr:BlaI/MecI/CopY family transcriptional regulator [Planctomycetota bacterium]
MHLSEAEWKLMHALWETAPRSARDVHGAVAEETGWAYTTVKTMLDRLVEKGALRSKMRSNQSFYSPSVTQQDARTTALRALLDRAFGGALGGLVAHMADDDELSAKERTEVEALLTRLEQRRKKT